MIRRSGDRVGLGMIVVLMVVVAVGVLWRGGDRPVRVVTNSNAGATSNAPQAMTVVVLFDIPTPLPTQTPEIRIVTATPTVTPTEAAICGQEKLGSPCLLFPAPMTPTPTATVRPCDRVTPSAAGYGTLCQPVLVSAARQETE